MRVQWELNGGARTGFQRPDISHDSELALDAWTFCSGWKPELIPMAAAYLRVDDLEGLIDRLLVIRGAVDMWQAAQAKT